jgi:ribulose-phosphate 3-epimerase
MERVESFAARIHVDVADGNFAPRKLISFDKIWWRGDRTIDLHVMYQRPAEHRDIILALAPRLVIVHAEAEGDFLAFADDLHRHGIEVGIALLPRTDVEVIKPGLGLIDHVLLFSGNLGHFGGEADLTLLKKVSTLRELKPTVEIGWDGGVNAHNARQLAEGGVDVLNVGGFIQRADSPPGNFQRLQALVAEADR